MSFFQTTSPVWTRKTSRAGHLTLALLAIDWIGGGALTVQAQTGESDRPSATASIDEGATIRGGITADAIPFAFDVTTLPVTIAEQMRYKPLPLPPDWGNRSEEQRRRWIQEFQESDAGKKFLEERELLAKNQRRFTLPIEEDGRFEIYDVPTGDYNLFGRKDVEVDSKKYALEVFGQFHLGDVDELELQPLPVTVTRLLTAGESAPDLEVDQLNAEDAKLSLTSFKDRPVLLYFWSAENAGAAEEARMLKATYETLAPELKLELLAVCVDETPDKARELVRAEELKWPQGRTNGWRHSVFAEFGLRSVPALYLVGPDGRLLLAHADFYRAFGTETPDLASVIRAAVSGKPAEK